MFCLMAMNLICRFISSSMVLMASLVDLEIRDSSETMRVDPGWSFPRSSVMRRSFGVFLELI